MKINLKQYLRHITQEESTREERLEARCIDFIVRYRHLEYARKEDYMKRGYYANRDKRGCDDGD